MLLSFIKTVSFFIYLVLLILVNLMRFHALFFSEIGNIVKDFAFYFNLL